MGDKITTFVLSAEDLALLRRLALLRAERQGGGRASGSAVVRELIRREAARKKIGARATRGA